MVAIDNTTLALLLHPGAKPHEDPKTRLPLVKGRERIEQLIDNLDAEDERMMIPTPVLCEFLILAGEEGPLYLEKIQGSRTLLRVPEVPLKEGAENKPGSLELDANASFGAAGSTNTMY